MLAALALGMLAQDFESLPETFSPGTLAGHPEVRRLVAGHRASLPEIERALASPSWKARLGAAFALKEAGFSHLLTRAVEDADPRVRDFARAVLTRSPRDRAPYARDAEQRVRSDELARAAALLDAPERAARMRALVADLLAPAAEETEPEAPPSFRDIALRLAARELPLAMEGLAEAARSAPAPALEAVGALALHGDLPALPTGLREAVEAGFSAADPALRGAAVRAGRVLPEEARAELLGRGMTDADPNVRRSSAIETLALVRAAHDTGRPERVDVLLERLQAFVQGERNESLRRGVAPAIEKTAGNIRREREMLLEGKSDDETGQGPRRRYLKVGKGLIAVSDREYELCLARGRGPYIPDEEFRTLRKTAAEERSAEPPKIPPRVEVPPAVEPAKAVRDLPPNPPPAARSRAVPAGVGLAAAALIGWFLLRPKRR
ncbi:MAG TPA: hypothetical protein VF950_17235 [Planctomycetota bacterium]